MLDTSIKRTRERDWWRDVDWSRPYERNPVTERSQRLEEWYASKWHDEQKAAPKLANSSTNCLPRKHLSKERYDIAERKRRAVMDTLRANGAQSARQIRGRVVGLSSQQVGGILTSLYDQKVIGRERRGPHYVYWVAA